MSPAKKVYEPVLHKSPSLAQHMINTRSSASPSPSPVKKHPIKHVVVPRLALDKMNLNEKPTKPKANNGTLPNSGVAPAQQKIIKEDKQTPSNYTGSPDGSKLFKIKEGQ